MKTKICFFLIIFAIANFQTNAYGESAIKVLGQDYSFKNNIIGLPKKIADFSDLEINSFTTNDGVKLSFWEAGKGEPLIFLPGWSSNGAEYINLIYLLKDKYHVYVLDHRNHGLSDKSSQGTRISRGAKDLNELVSHLGFEKVYIVGWSMGASITWSFIDLFGEKSIKKLVFIDQAPSVYSHSDWSEEERKESGAFTSSPESMIRSFGGEKVNRLVVNSDVTKRFLQMDSPFFENSQLFSAAFIKPDFGALKLIMFDHVTNDWRDVISKKITVPTAIFTGEDSDWLESQKWMNSVISGSSLFIYKKKEFGDHFLHLKNPVKFSQDLHHFLSEKGH